MEVADQANPQALALELGPELGFDSQTVRAKASTMEHLMALLMGFEMVHQTVPEMEYLMGVRKGLLMARWTVL